MIKGRLTTREAAERLGVKPETIYAYVSRGLLTADRNAKGSTFDPQEVARLMRSSRKPLDMPRPGDRRRDTGDPVFVTRLSSLSAGQLLYRGIGAVELSRSKSFEEVAEWLWFGQWPDSVTGWEPHPSARRLSAAVAAAKADALPVERYLVAASAAALTDNLRHDLSPPAVAIAGRSLIATLVESLPSVSAKNTEPKFASISERLWPRLSPLPLTSARLGVLEAALVLSADHELAPSTLAARVAAAFRADPYSVVCSGLGPASGSWYSGSSGAPGEVEALLAEAEGAGAERAIGDRLRRTGSAVHGFGMPLYPNGDPRGAELLARVGELGSTASRRRLVGQVIAVGQGRGFPPPNVDMGLGALSFVAEMIPGAGQAIATLGKVAGWIGHAMEEYDTPTRFRARAVYVGEAPVDGR